MIIIDYLQLIEDKYSKNSEERNAKISRGIKNLAKSLDVPIILLCQLNNKVFSNETRKPNLSHLRGSGQIAQAADIVAFVYRPEVYDIAEFPDGTSTAGIMEIKIEKGRNIGLHSMRCGFNDATQKIYNLS